MIASTSGPEWPAHFPPGCPPLGTPDADGEVFRFVENDPPALADMVSWLELGIGTGRDCRRAALSCSLTREHLEEVRRAGPRRRNDRIARATLGPAHGKLGPTGAPGHYSLWVRHAFRGNLHRIFEVVA